MQNGALCHQYADDTQLYLRISPKEGSISDLSKCADQFIKWFLSNGQMLIPSKTEAILFGTAARLRTNASAMPRLTIAGVNIPFVDSVRMLGFTLDSSLSLNKHVANTVATCNFHIRALRHIRSSLTPQPAVMMGLIACSWVNKRLDYCNALLVINPNHNIIRL